MCAGNLPLILCAGAVTVAVSAAAAEAPSYTFTTLDVPGASSTAARGINDLGQIVGFFSDSAGTHGFFLDADGSFTAIDVPGASLTTARSINTAGKIVGYFTDSAGTHGFLDTGGSFTTIDVPGATASFGTFALGINDANQIVGDFFIATGQQHGFLDENGKFTTIDVPGVMHSSAATSISNASRIVGYYDMKHGFLDIGGSFIMIDVPGSQTTFPFGINGAGRIVGFFGNIGLGQLCGPKKPTHGFLDSGGNFTTIDVPGATQTCAYGINDLGQIVGLFSDSTGTHGFLASPGDSTAVTSQ
jgi:probable HAF family extracellular repeat protein